MRIFLDMAPAQTPVERARLTYAFRLFCAVYGHQAIVQSAESGNADVWITYSKPSKNGVFRRIVKLANSFKARDPREEAPPPQAFAAKDQATVLVHSPVEGATPDWLGEVFEWVSCADEYSISSRDSLGRIPFRDTYAGRHGLDLRLPYAAIAMCFLQREICKLIPAAPAQPASPVHDAGHFIINTHDVDFLPLDRRGSVSRLAKNSAISLLLLKSPKLALRQLWKLASLTAGGTNPFDQVPQLAERENREGITASYYFIPRKKHPKDANYSLDHPIAKHFVRLVELLGMEVGVHGSFTSLDEAGGLASEFGLLREQGFSPIGERQHWLRFTLDRLIPAMEEAHALYDTSVGWSDRAGFRAGACFAFPPYDFKREAPAPFLEMPLAAMDQGLLPALGKERGSFGEAAEVLATSRRYGWGGISLLWHPAAFDGVQLPEEIGETFWHLVELRSRWNDTWLSGQDFLNQVRFRYEDVGFSLDSKSPVRSFLVQPDRQRPELDCAIQYDSRD
jgi:hypothetical protein